MKTLHIQLSILTKLSLLGLSLLSLPIQSYARDVEFSWTINSPPVTGYKLYYKTGDNSLPPYNGTGITQGSSPIIIEGGGEIRSIALTGLSPNETYHFALTAVDGTDESGYTTPAVSFEPLSMTSPTINIMSQN